MGNSIKLLFMALLFAPVAWADVAVPGATLPGLLQWLEQDSAELAAMRHEAAGAELRAEAAGALPDPSLRIEWGGLNRSGVPLDPSRVDATKYTVLQPVPGWGKRDAQKQAAQAGAALAGAQQRAVGAELRARMTLAFAQYYQSQRALALNDEFGGFTDSAAKLVQSRYETGAATQQELVRAQLEQAAQQSERLQLQSDLAQAQARINALLNRPAHAALASPEVLPEPPAAARLEGSALEQRLRDANPQLAGQAAQTDLAQRNAELAQRNLSPDFILGIAPVQRGNGIRSLDAMLEFTLPLQQVAHHAHQHEASEMVDASRARQQAAETRLLGELREHLAALEAARAQQALLHQRVSPLAELAFKGALAGNQSGRVDFATLLEARRQLQKTRLDELGAEVAQQLHLAEIERLIGGQP
ncbi:MAG: TolC family protein [Nitrosomonadales bacterium]|nr:TolC family protein [Nitrosomonadales bacterium]